MGNMKFMILAVVLAAFGCKSGEKAEMDLTAQEWELKSMTKNDTVVVNPQELPTLVFKDSTVYGSAGCNRFFGTYKSDKKGALTIKTGGVTMMYCPDMSFEDRYLKALNEVSNYSIKEKELMMTDAKKKLVLVYQPVDTTKKVIGVANDDHGCNAAAGYTWSEVWQNCIRLFEDGVRLNSVTDTASTSSAFVVFSADSTKAEVFLPDNANRPVLDRRELPNRGGYAWNQEDDDTLNVRKVGSDWVIEQRGKLLYKQDKK